MSHQELVESFVLPLHFSSELGTSIDVLLNRLTVDDPTPITAIVSDDRPFRDPSNTTKAVFTGEMLVQVSDVDKFDLDSDGNHCPTCTIGGETFHITDFGPVAQKNSTTVLFWRAGLQRGQTEQPYTNALDLNDRQAQ